MWQQLVDGTGLLGRQSSQYVLEVDVGIVAVELRRLDQTHDRRRALPRQ